MKAAQPKWEKAKYQGTQLAGKTLGVVGLGRIGQTVASRALAMEMTVIGFDPFYSQPTALEGRVKLVRDFDEFLAQIDVITFHVPGGEGTKHLLNRDRLFNKCKPNLLVDQRRPRRSGRRIRPGRGAQGQEDRRRGDRRLRQGTAAAGSPAVHLRERRADAAPGGADGRSADGRLGRCLQGDRRLPQERRDPRRGERRRAEARSPARRSPLRRARPPHRRAARRVHRDAATRRSPSAPAAPAPRS